MPSVAVCYIATGPYINFFDKYRRTARSLFLHDCDRHFFVWSDTRVSGTPDTTYVYKKWERWPEATKYRYRTMLTMEDELKDFDYVTFTNANTWFTKPSRLSDFFDDDKPFTGSGHWSTYRQPEEKVNEYLRDAYWSNLPDSHAYVPLERYYDVHGGWLLGGCQGGRSGAWLDMCREVTEWMLEDEAMNLRPRWNDEPYYNRYTMDYPTRVLDPGLWLSYGLNGFMHLEGKEKALGYKGFRSSARQPIGLLNRLRLLQ